MFRWTALLLLLLYIGLSSTTAAQSFRENKGQWPDQVRYLSELSGASIYLEDDGLLIDLKDPGKSAHIADEHLSGHPTPAVFHHHAYRMRFIGEPTTSESMGRVVHRGRHNYFIGNDEDDWASNVRTFTSVEYKAIYEGIDGHFYYSAKGEFKYDLIIEPGARASDIRIQYSGVSPTLTDSGDLLIQTATGDVREAHPYAYQQIDGVDREVECSFIVENDVVRFEVEKYDAGFPLVIDPILVFSTFSGSVSQNFGYTATFDRKGFLYSGSTAFGPEYPVTMGAYDETFNGGQVDIAISKYDSTGTFLVYSTYIGGSASDIPHSIIVNDQDELYMFGTSGSADYPVTDEAYMDDFLGGFGVNISGIGAGFPNGCDMVISRLSADGDELLSSTYMGGNGNDGINIAEETNFNYADELRGEIELDSDGNVYVASCSAVPSSGTNDFPVSVTAVMPSAPGGLQDGVVFKMPPGLNDLEWSTFFGGAGNDAALSIAIKENGDVVVAGGTASTDLPTTPSVVGPDYSGGMADGFVVVLNEDVSTVLNCSYWGTSTYDQAYMVELDRFDNIHLFGQTFSGDELIIDADYSNSNSGQFVSKFTSDIQSVIWSTAFGNGNGEPNISPTAFAVDLCNRVYLSGWGGPTGGGGLTTNGLDTTPDAFQSTTNGGDFYLLSIADDASELIYATYFGGPQSDEHVDGGTSRFDKKGNVYQSVCAGCGGNSDFPIQPANAVSPTNNNVNCNNAVFKMDFELPAIVADFLAEPVCLPDTTRFDNTSLGGLTFEWDFGDGEGSDEPEPEHIYAQAGNYQVSLIISDPLSCNLADTVSYPVLVASAQAFTLDTLTACDGEPIQIGIPPLPGSGFTYSWDNGDLLDQTDVSNPTATITDETTFTLTTDFGICISTATQTVLTQSIDLQTSGDTLICDGDVVTLSASSLGTSDTYLWSDSPDFDPILSTDSFLVAEPMIGTTYYIRTGEECLEEGTIDVLLASEQILFSQNQYVCANDPVMLSVTNLYPSVGFSIDWSPDAPILTGDGTAMIQVSVEEEEWFAADIINDHGCMVLDSILVEVSPLSGLLTTATADAHLIPAGGSTFIHAEPSPGYDYQWTPTDGVVNSTSSTTEVFPPQTTTYTINVIDTDINGSCSKSDKVTIQVFEFVCGFPTIFLPNAFTPNNDGDNDVLYVRSDLVTSIDLAIYDRWGELVFETTDQDIGWDGRYEGKELDPAVYVYHLKIGCQDGQQTFEKGNVTLIR